MEALIFFSYEILTSLVPFYVAFTIFRSTAKKKGLIHSRWNGVVVSIFAIYVIGLFQITGTGTIYDGFWYEWEIRNDQLNLIPFSNGVDITSCLNVLLFIPLGLMVPYLCQKVGFIKTLGVGFALTVLVETSQLLNNRRTDIDDVILNLVGTVIGFGIMKIWRILTKMPGRQTDVTAAEILVYLLVMFAGRFFFYDGMSMARLLYGF